MGLALRVHPQVNNMIIGFTGTRAGMTRPQRELFTKVIVYLGTKLFVHGDCTGSDEQAHDIVRLVSPGTRIAIWPPLNPKNRAYKQGDTVHPPEPYLARNDNIVNDVERMIATPKGMSEEHQGSGTWHAIHYTLEVNKPLMIIWPNGNSIVHNG